MSDLLSAIRKNDVKTINKLINLKDGDGYTSLMDAVLSENSNMVKTLLDHGANIDTKNNKGWTALMLAVFNKFKEIVKILLDHKADVNIKNNDGINALQLALSASSKEIVSMLLKVKGIERDYSVLRWFANKEMLNYTFPELKIINKLYEAKLEGDKVRNVTGKILKEISILPRGAIKSFAWRNPTTKKIELFTLKMAHNGHIVLKNKKRFYLGTERIPINKEKFIRKVRSLSFPNKKRVKKNRLTSPTKEHVLEQKPFGIISERITIL